MSSDHQAEIRASVAAHRDLGPGYDEAVAEGLVERIGEEIDKRIDIRLGQIGQQWVPAHQAARHQPPGCQAGYQVPQAGCGVPRPRRIKERALHTAKT